MKWFEQIQVRYFALVWVGLTFYLPGGDLLASTLLYNAPWYGWILGFWYYQYTLVILALAATVLTPAHTPIKVIVGPQPTATQMRPSLAFTLFLFPLSMVCLYVMYLPLSYIAPDFVNYWLIDLPDWIYFEGDQLLFLPNVATLVITCVVAPVVEEFAFRGVILHRWTHKYGLWPAILWSSLLFAVVHPDILGAFTFGIGMCILYLRTQSLWVPILCHSAYNLFVWCWDLTFMFIDGPDFVYTLETLQSGWPWGAAAAVIVVVWAALYLRRPRPPVTWTLPAL